MWTIFAAALLSASVGAQSHPCDVVLPNPPVATKGNTLGWCHDLLDDDGYKFSALGFRLLVNNAQVIDVGLRSPLGGANAEGLYYFESPLPNGYGRGVYDLKVIAVVPGEADSLSTDYALWQVGGPANKPQKPRIGGGGG